MLNVAVKFRSSRQRDSVTNSLISYDIENLKCKKNLLVAVQQYLKANNSWIIDNVKKLIAHNNTIYILHRK